jgi:hypothetical protein
MLKSLAEGAIAEYVVRKDPPGEVIVEPALKEDTYPHVGPLPVPESDTTGNAAYYRYLFLGDRAPEEAPVWDIAKIQEGAELMKQRSEEALKREEAMQAEALKEQEQTITEETAEN